MIWEHPRQWEDVLNIIKSFNVNLKVIMVFRNPYDIIASDVLTVYEFKSDKIFAEMKQSKAANKVYPKPQYINARVNDYFSDLQVIVNAKEKYSLDMIEIHNKDLISNPKGTLLKLCNDLGVTCFDNYLKICSNKIYKNESRTRRLIKWTKKDLEVVQQNIEKYSCLKGYSFDSS